MEAVFSVMKKAEKKEEVICESCSRQSSIAFCKNCRHYICDRCAESHKLMSIFSNHEVISIPSLLKHFKKSGASRVPIEAQELKCHKHTNEPLKLYCYTCHQLVCRDCTLIDHKDHKYAFIVDAIPRCKSTIKVKVESLQNLSCGLKTASKLLTESEKKLKDHNAATIKAIDDAHNRIVLKLQQKSKELKAATAKMINSSQEKIASQKKNIDLAVGEVDSLYDFLSRNLERATDQELFSLLKQMSDQAERAAQLYADPPSKFPVPTPPQLEVHCSNRVLQVLQEEFSVSEKGAAKPLTHDTSLPSPQDTPPDEEMMALFPNLNGDALALLKRLPEGDIPGMEYNVRDGSVKILLEKKSEIDKAITKFQAAYKKVALSNERRLRVECVDVLEARTRQEVEAQIAKFEQQYKLCAFVLLEEKRQVKIISQARQFEQAKTFFLEALQQSGAIAQSASPANAMVLTLPSNRRLTLKMSNIVEEETEAIVNAANERLMHGGGVAGALNAASQGQLQTYCNNYMEKKRKGADIPVGEVAVTHGGGSLKCKHVIHAVGPESYMHSNKESKRLIKVAIESALRAAETRNVASIAIPALSCGIVGVSKELVAQVITDAILGFHFTKLLPTLTDIRIVIIDEPTHSCFARYFSQKAHTLFSNWQRRL